jgi:uncharacterized protein
MISIDHLKCSLDFNREGKQFGNIDLGYSNNQYAFDKIPTPIICIKNGSGPTLLLSAGNHGDEYEGQVILRRLIHETEAQDINGRLIILPALNYPAMLDNARVSPLDQGNMNRSFPGEAGGSPTSAIADFVTTQLLPLVDAGIDLHSGGSTSYYLPCTFLCTAADPEITQKNLGLIGAFNAPNTLVVRGESSATGFDPIANRAGVPFISTELYGGGNVDRKATELGMTGVRNVMQHMGIISNQTVLKSSIRFFNGIDGSDHLSSPYSGIFEPVVELGDEVTSGDIAGQLYSAEEVERKPLTLRFNDSGTVLVRRNGARVRRGSHLFLVASSMSRKQISTLS